jgi:4-hydroxy-2-oxoheptanedioate aldolase
LSSTELDEAGAPRIAIHGTTADADVVELCAVAGAAAYIIDLEHGTATVKECAGAIRAGDAFGLAVFARVTSQGLETASRLLDAGAQGVLVADVRDSADCELARQKVFHPPDGRRGFGGCRENSYGLRSPPRRSAPKTEPLLGVQIESASGLANLEAILSQPRVQLVMVGTRDLAADLGHCEDLQHPQVRQSVRRVAASAHQHGVGFGIMVRSPEQTAPAMELRPSWLLLPLAVVVRSGFEVFSHATTR